MDKTIIMMLLVSTFFGCSRSSPAEKRSVDPPPVHFSVDGNLLQIRLLSAEDITTTEVSQFEENTNFAVINLVPNPIHLHAPSDTTLQTLSKMKDLLGKLAKLLDVHKEEMLLLMKHEEVVHSPHVITIEKEVTKQPSNDDVNIHVHADQPLQMRTLIGYPQDSHHEDAASSQNQQATKIRIYQRDFPSSTPDIPPPKQELASEEEAFIRRGSEFLLSMWRRFRAARRRQDGFNEEMVNADYF